MAGSFCYDTHFSICSFRLYFVDGSNNIVFIENCVWNTLKKKFIERQGASDKPGCFEIKINNKNIIEYTSKHFFYKCCTF
jgi:hypothetical protein